jgi:DNA-3-methyladenine glycosylase II
MTDFKASITGPYSLARQSGYFGGWLRPAEDDGSILMAFPTDGPFDGAAVRLRQLDDSTVAGTVYGPGDHAAAWRQALAVLSLDADGSGWAEIGERDEVIGALQREHAHLRPVLFYSPYEAACAFVIAHRLRIQQGRDIRARLSAAAGTAIDAGGTTVHAFPAPATLLGLDAIENLPAEKITRLHGVAEAALDGRLSRERLRAMPVDEALADLRTLRGIGDFFATAILMRGAGLVDAYPDDRMTRAGIGHFYDLGEPTDADVARITGGWRPYRMWCSVLVHASERRSR